MKALFAFLFVIVTTLASAHAEFQPGDRTPKPYKFTVCNRTEITINVAYAYPDVMIYDDEKSAWPRSVGWFNVAPGSCRTDGNFPSRLYVYAEMNGPKIGKLIFAKQGAEKGQYCVNNQYGFSIEGIRSFSCPPDQKRDFNFVDLSTESAKWSISL